MCPPVSAIDVCAQQSKGRQYREYSDYGCRNMAVRAGQVRTLVNIGTFVRGRLGCLGTVGEMPPAGVTVPNLAGTLIPVANFTKTIIRTGDIIIRHRACYRKKQQIGKMTREKRIGRKWFAVDAQSSMTNVRIS